MAAGRELERLERRASLGSAPFYANLVGLLVFHDIPDPLALVGAAVISAGGLYVLRQETRGSTQPMAVEAVVRLP